MRVLLVAGLVVGAVLTSSPAAGAACVGFGPNGPYVEFPCDSDPFIDGVFCGVFAYVLPPEGDVPGIWDCPPYGD